MSDLLSSDSALQHPPEGPGAEGPRDSNAMDPGHVDFVLEISEQLNGNQEHVSNAMPVSKWLNVALVTLGLLMLLAGISSLGAISMQTLLMFSKHQAIGLALVLLGSSLVFIAVRSWFLFLYEVLELAH